MVFSPVIMQKRRIKRCKKYYCSFFVNSATPIRLSLQKDYSLDTLIIFFKASFRFESIVVMNKG